VVSDTFEEKTPEVRVFMCVTMATVFFVISLIVSLVSNYVVNTLL